MEEYGEGRFVWEIKAELENGEYRAQDVRRVHIPKPGQPGKTRPQVAVLGAIGIPTLKDRMVQMAVKMVKVAL